MNLEVVQAMFDRDVARMLAFKDISDADIQGIKAPALVINGAITYAAECPLAILPSGHGDYIGEICAADKDTGLPF